MRNVSQVRQFYVADTFIDGTDISDMKDAEVKSIQMVVNDTTKDFYFRHKGAGGLVRTDVIPFKRMMWAKATSADDMAYTLKACKITLNPNVNEGNVIPGQDYILNVHFKEYIAYSDEHQYFKFGCVRGFPNMEPKTFYLRMAESLFKNFSREDPQLVVIGLSQGDDTTWLTPDTNFRNYYTDGVANDDWDGVVIREAIQPWHRGIHEERHVEFLPVPSSVFFGMDLVWGIVEPADSGITLNNGRKTADLEWFCMGERGDMYRGMDYPNIVPTFYLVDPTQEYHFLDLHFCFIDDNEAVQKSERDLTIVSTDKDVINTIVGKINEFYEPQISTLSVRASAPAVEPIAETPA